MAFCSQCGADVTGASFCAKCGAPVRGAAASGGGPAASGAAGPQASAPTGAASSDNLVGAWAYFTPIPAIIFLVIEPYKNNHFIRFHSFQSIFFCLAAIALHFVVAILSPVLEIGIFVVWVILVIKAYQGEVFKLPLIGDLAAKQA